MIRPMCKPSHLKIEFTSENGAKIMKRIRRIVAFILIGIPVLATAQLEKKESTAVRITNSPRIDGILDDAAWKEAPVLSDFVQWTPYNGDSPSQPTEVFVCYDDDALYVGIRLHDSAPDSILTELGDRDSGNHAAADFVVVHVSPYNDGINSLYFGLSASGVQTDYKFFGDDADADWDAVWKSEVRITDEGWIAEVKIPYSALRFPKQDIQDWGFNIWRMIPRHQEWSSWSFVDIEYSPWFRYMGILRGFQDIQPPIRLSFTPYLSGYIEKDVNGKWGYYYNGGLDLKYGINESFTLDMTLIPDFGQVQSDDELLNLSPFEIRYNERRQFFTEGTELFNKGEIFYSRRIGGTPAGSGTVEDELNAGEYIHKNPSEAQLINVSKLSGRTNGGLGIGFLNAMTAPAKAVAKDSLTGHERDILTQAFTNYNMFVLDQTLPNNSYISLINSNVWRKAYIANVTATEFRLADRANDYHIKGIAAASQIHDDEDPVFGYKAELEAGKVSGQFQYEYGLEILSDTYDQNDLGYLRRNNHIGQEYEVSYHIFEPFGPFRTLTNSLYAFYNRMYKPNTFADFSLHYSLDAHFKNNYYFSMHASFNPVERRDYYEPRVEGRFLKNSKYYHNCFVFGTDQVKRLSLFLHGGFTNAYDYVFKSRHWRIDVSPTYRVSDRLSFMLSMSYGEDNDQPGYVSTDENNGDIYIGKRDRQTAENTLTTMFLFTNRMSLRFRLRHYWSRALHDSYYTLQEDGNLTPSAYSEDHDVSYNIFNIDMVYRWVFAPGSELLVVWKNDIDHEGDPMNNDYWRNFSNTLRAPQVNSFSIKLLYYLDFLSK